MIQPIYLDHNATTPLFEELHAQIPLWLETWGNPSSIHWAGRAPKTLLREARQNLAQMLGVTALELIFTSGGSEANNLALQGLVPKNGRNRIVISAVEHPSVFKTAQAMTARGFKVDVVPVSRTGQLDMPTLKTFLNEETHLVSCMLANNETGHIFPLTEVARLAHEVGAFVHCDAVQGFGKVPLNFRELGVDLASLSGHKFYALKGAGILYARRGLDLGPLIHGGGQERGRRAGTENLLGIASLGFMALKSAAIPLQADRLAVLRDYFETRILAEVPDVWVTGQEGLRLPNTSSLVIAGVDGETLMMNLDVRGFAVSTGAACSAGNPEPSPTLLAMGLTRKEAQSSLRVSFGWSTTLEQVQHFVASLKTSIERLRGFGLEDRLVHGL